MIQDMAPGARDFTQRRYRFKDRIDVVLKARNWTKSRIRSRVEHCFGVIKGVFGFTKVRYRRLAKNGSRVFVTEALANLFMALHHLMGAVRP